MGQHGKYSTAADLREMSSSFAEETSVVNEYVKVGNSKIYAAPDSALRYYRAAYKISNRINYQNGLAVSLASMAKYYRKKRQYAMCISYYQQAQQHLNNWTGSIEARNRFIYQLYHDIASAYFYMGAYAQSAKYYYMVIAMPRMNTKADRNLLMAAYEGLGSIWTRMDKYKQGLTYLELAEQIALACKDTLNLLGIYANKSGLYNNVGAPEQAKAYALKALKLGASIPNNIDMLDSVSLSGSIAIASSNVALVLMKEDSLSQALYYANKSLEYVKGSPEDLYSITGMLAYLNYRTGNYKKAEEYLLPALEKAIKTGASENIGSFYSLLATLNYVKGNYKAAYEYKDAYVTITDSLRGGKNAQLITNLEIENKLVSKERELLRNKLEMMSQNDELKKKNLIIGSICIGALLSGAFGFYRYSNKQKLQEKRISLLQQEQEIQQLRAMMEGEEKERMRIARDLHDGVSQTISATKVNLMAIEAQISFTDASKKDKFEKIIEMIDSSFNEVRNISHNMMPFALREAGLETLIKQMIDNIASDSLTVNLQSNGLEEHFDSNIETVIYRVIQECINNVLKHSKATRLDISLSKDDDGLRITIEDNGVGFDARDSNVLNGIGMNNIKARVHYLHGQVEFDSSVGNGTVVSIHVPV